VKRRVSWRWAKDQIGAVAPRKKIRICTYIHILLSGFSCIFWDYDSVSDKKTLLLRIWVLPTKGKQRQREKSALLATCFMLVSCLAYSSTWRWTQHVLPKRGLTFNGLYNVISQKIGLFITTTVRISNPTYNTVSLTGNRTQVLNSFSARRITNKVVTYELTLFCILKLRIIWQVSIK
jgi:hypothetical protein